MGYYVETVEIDISLSKEHYAQAYEIMCDLNELDDYKQGGSFGAGKDVKWFSWMTADYPSECKNPQEIFEMLGFECYEDETHLWLTNYDSKIGQEDLFLSSICPLLYGYIKWRGEDGEEWMDNYDGMTVKRYYRSEEWTLSEDYDGPIEMYKRMADIRKEYGIKFKTDKTGDDLFDRS